MSETSEIHLTCSCGAKLDYTERVSEPYYSHIGVERSAFLKAHEACSQSKPAKDMNKFNEAKVKK